MIIYRSLNDDAPLMYNIRKAVAMATGLDFDTQVRVNNQNVPMGPYDTSIASVRLLKYEQSMYGYPYRTLNYGARLDNKKYVYITLPAGYDLQINSAITNTLFSHDIFYGMKDVNLGSYVSSTLCEVDIDNVNSGTYSIILRNENTNINTQLDSTFSWSAGSFVNALQSSLRSVTSITVSCTDYTSNTIDIYNTYNKSLNYIRLDRVRTSAGINAIFPTEEIIYNRQSDDIISTGGILTISTTVAMLTESWLNRGGGALVLNVKDRGYDSIVMPLLGIQLTDISELADVVQTAIRNFNDGSAYNPLGSDTIVSSTFVNDVITLTILPSQGGAGNITKLDRDYIPINLINVTALFGNVSSQIGVVAREGQDYGGVLLLQASGAVSSATVGNLVMEAKNDDYNTFYTIDNLNFSSYSGSLSITSMSNDINVQLSRDSITIEETITARSAIEVEVQFRRENAISNSVLLKNNMTRNDVHEYLLSVDIDLLDYRNFNNFTYILSERREEWGVVHLILYCNIGTPIQRMPYIEAVDGNLKYGNSSTTVSLVTPSNTLLPLVDFQQ